MKTAPCCQLLEGQLESLLSLSGCRHIACHREGNKFTRTASPSVTNRDTAETKGQARSWGLICAHIPRPSLRREGAQLELPPKPTSIQGTPRGFGVYRPRGWSLSVEIIVSIRKAHVEAFRACWWGSAMGRFSTVPRPASMVCPCEHEERGLGCSQEWGTPREGWGSGCKLICLGTDGWVPTLLKSDCPGSALRRRSSPPQEGTCSGPNSAHDLKLSQTTDNSVLCFEVIFSVKSSFHKLQKSSSKNNPPQLKCHFFKTCFWRCCSEE